MEVKILITGIGITGKSSFRRHFVDYLKRDDKTIEYYDTDEFKELRDLKDSNCKKPTYFDPNITYVIEDIHGTTEESFLPVKEYDIIIYLLPGMLSHAMFWFSRMWKWFQEGRYSWEKTGWKGTGKGYDPRNIFPIIKTFLCDMKNRKRWILEDLDTIRTTRHYILHPSWKSSGIYCDFLGKKIRLL